MNWLFYELKEIPDISLAKYQSLGEMGVEGVLEKHASFLRQWQRFSVICNIGLHLYILYEPDNLTANKINIFLGFSFDNKEVKRKLYQMMLVSPLSDYFSFVENTDNILKELERLEFSYEATMKKQERKKVTEDETHMELFTVEGWKTNKSARLYDLFRSLSALNERALYVASLYGVEAFQKASDVLAKPISILRKKTFGQSDLIKLKENHNRNIRDIALEDTLKCYEDFLNMTANSPCFQANIRVLSNDKLTVQLLLNAACGEAIEEGNCKISGSIGSHDTVAKKNCLDEVYEIMPLSLKFWPTLYSLEEIEPFFRFPVLYDGEYIDIKKETCPNYNTNGLMIGQTYQKEAVGISLEALMKHVFVCGVPGSGKTNTMLHIANSLWKNREERFGKIIERPIPFLVFEPAKREYRELALFDIPELIIFSPSANTRFPLQINPFEFPKGLTLSEHITRVRQVFEGAFPIQAPAPFILDQSIEAIYKKHNWKTNDINVGDKEYPTISELYEEFKQQIQTTSYDSEIQGNIRSVLEMRIGSLIRREKKDIFDVRRSIISPEEWLKRPVIIELEALGKETANFVTLLICTLIRETIKVNPMEGIEKQSIETVGGNVTVQTWKPLRHVIFIEEAHNLIAPQSQVEANQESNPKIAATECIVDMLKEVRALREGVIIADQLPTAMATDVIKNTNVKLVHRLTSGDDRGMVGSTMAASELQLEQVATYLPGQALMTYEGLLKPFEIRVTNLENHGSETPDDDRLFEIMKEKSGQQEIYRRLEYRKWIELEKKVEIAVSMENLHRKALREYDFYSKTFNQMEDFFENCFVKLQALLLLRQTYLSESRMLQCDYLKKQNKEVIVNVIQMIGEKYREEVQFYIKKYMKEENVWQNHMM